jgi:hypothetical protein
MPKKAAQDFARAARQQLGFEKGEAPPRSGDAAGRVLEQTVGGGGNPTAGATSQHSKKQAAEATAADKIKTEQEYHRLISELEEEIEKYRRVRRQQLKARRQQPDDTDELPPEMIARMTASRQKKAKQALVEPAAKPAKGLRMGLRARKRSSQPELSGSRRSG